MTSSLPPVPTPIAIFPQFIASTPSTLMLKEHVLSFSGDDFSIKLADGTPVLRVEGKVMSMSGRKKMSDMEGNHICTISKEMFHLHPTYVVDDAKDARIAEVRSSLTCKFFFFL
jgi:uncharacterized protein YxjI